MRQSLIQDWLKKILVDSLQGQHLDGKWLVRVCAALDEIDDDDFDHFGAEAFLAIYGQIHWIPDPGGKRAVIECLLSQPWDEPNPFEGDLTLLDEYCRTLGEERWDRDRARRSLRELVRLTSPVAVVEALLRYLGEESVLSLLSNLGLSYFREVDWGPLRDLGTRLFDANRLNERIELLTHFLAYIHPRWASLLSVSQMLECCNDLDRLEYFLQDRSRFLLWEVDHGVLSETEARLLLRIWPPDTDVSRDAKEAIELRESVYREITKLGDILTWIHTLPEIR